MERGEGDPGGMVVVSEPVMVVEKIRKLVCAPGQTEVALAGRALILFQIDEMQALEGNCVMKLLRRLQTTSRDTIIGQCNLDELCFEDIMVCLKRKEQGDNLMVLTTKTVGNPMSAVKEWSGGSG